MSPKPGESKATEGREGRAELPERWSAGQKTEVVLRLLRGEDLGEVSRVRVWVTYGAALYVFLFGAILCGLLLWLGSDATGMAEAKDLFLATLPIGSGILAYWFAARGRSSSGDNDK